MQQAVEVIKASLRLFGAVPLSAVPFERQFNLEFKPGITLKQGYVLDPKIPMFPWVMEAVDEVVGINGEKMNAAFHKSWAAIQNTPIEALVFQQMVHYLTTYGFEACGVYHKDTVYIPKEKLEVPGLNVEFRLRVVKAFSDKQLVENVVALGGSGIALAQNTLDDIMVIVKHSEIVYAWIPNVENRELKTLLRKHYGIVPSDPVEYLRYVIAELTGESLLIKNKYLIQKIREADGTILDQLLEKVPDNIGTIFLRYKPLFLAMKFISKNKWFFNRIRRDAKTMHKPLPVDYLNDVTCQLKKYNNGYLTTRGLKESLRSASIFRKIRLAYALKYRMTQAKSIVYQIRNGRSWATAMSRCTTQQQDLDFCLEITMDSIANSLEDLCDQVFYIPENVHYTIPATEKQFVGHLPAGSYVSVQGPMVAGIHWTNTEKRRVDLDLAALTADGKIGWDARYRGPELLFSGDVTAAPPPRGASELFWVKPGEMSALMTVNDYNFEKNDPVKTNLFVASGLDGVKEVVEYNYMVDPNNIIMSANLEISQKQNLLGIIMSNGEESRFYFAVTAIGSGRSSSNNQVMGYAREAFIHKFTNGIMLRTVLDMAGAQVVSERPDSGEYTDLSPMVLDKTTFLDLLGVV